MKRILSLIAMFLTCICFSAWAGDSPDSLQQKKVKIIREAIYFYANVPALNKKHNVISSCSEDYSIDSLLKCASGLDQSVKAKIKKWSSSSIENAEVLAQFGDSVINDATKNNTRTEIQGYSKFISAVHDLAPHQKPGQQIEKPNKSPTYTPDSASLQTMIDAAIVKRDAEKTVWPLYLLTGLGLLASLAALAKTFIFFKKKERDSSGSGSSQHPSRYETLRREMGEKFIKMDQEINNVKNSIIEAKNQLRSQKQDNNEQGDQAMIATYPPKEVFTPNVPTKAILYAKNAENGAFDADMLSSEADRQKIYELTIESKDSASYRVTDNREAQLFALEDVALYLRGVCDYAGQQPKGDSTIVTRKPGKLRMEGNKWKIMKMVKIEFH